MKVLETPTIFTDDKYSDFPRLVLKGRRSPVPKGRDFSLWFPRCMGITILSLDETNYCKPQVEMLVSGASEGEISDPRVLSVYLMFCTYLTLYFLNFSSYRINFTRQLEGD